MINLINIVDKEKTIEKYFSQQNIFFLFYTLFSHKQYWFYLCVDNVLCRYRYKFFVWNILSRFLLQTSDVYFVDYRIWTLMLHDDLTREIRYHGQKTKSDISCECVPQIKAKINMRRKCKEYVTSHSTLFLWFHWNSISVNNKWKKRNLYRKK